MAMAGTLISPRRCSCIIDRDRDRGRRRRSIRSRHKVSVEQEEEQEDISHTNHLAFEVEVTTTMGRAFIDRILQNSYL